MLDEGRLSGRPFRFRDTTQRGCPFAASDKQARLARVKCKAGPLLAEQASSHSGAFYPHTAELQRGFSTQGLFQASSQKARPEGEQGGFFCLTQKPSIGRRKEGKDISLRCNVWLQCVKLTQPREPSRGLAVVPDVF